MNTRIIGIVLVIAALVTVFLGIKAGGAAPENKKIIKNAVVVSDGKVLPENEGKVVIVTGTLEAPLPFVDAQTGIELNSIVAYRHVEKLVVVKDDEGNPDTWRWDVTTQASHYGGNKKLIAPNVAFGGFQLSDTLMQAVNAHDHLDDYSYVDLSALGVNDFKEDGIVYLYAGRIMPHNEDKISTTDLFGRANYDYLDLVDTLRVRYDVIADESMEYTVIGLQKNGTLEDVEQLKMTDMIHGNLTVDELLAYADTSASSAKTTAFIIAAILAVAGVLVILRDTKAAKVNRGQKRA